MLKIYSVLYVDIITHIKHVCTYKKNNESMNHKIKQKVTFVKKKEKKVEVTGIEVRIL